MAEEAVVQTQEPEKKKKEGLALTIDRITYVVAVIMGIYHLVAANFTIFQAGQHINIHLTLSLIIVCLQGMKLKNNKIGIRDILLLVMLAASIITGVYIHFHYTQFMTAFGTPPMNIFRGTIAKEGEKLFFRNANMSLELPETWTAAAEKFIEKDVLFGIRPEDIGSERAELAEKVQHIRAKIEVMEPMGAETYLYLDAPTDNGVSCIARVDAHKQAKVGEVLSLPILVANAHLFDPASTNILV